MADSLPLLESTTVSSLGFAFRLPLARTIFFCRERMTWALFRKRQTGAGHRCTTTCHRIVSRACLVLAILMGPASSRAQETSSLDAQLSRVRLGALVYSLQLPDSPAVVPALPDLTRNGVYELPGGLLLELPLPVIWSGTLLPPGKHSLAIEVSSRSVVQLLARPLGGGPSLRIPVVRGILDRPGERILATLSAVEGSEGSQLVLRLQWGALLLACQGQRVAVERQQLGDWILDTYRFPAHFSPPVHCVIGVIESGTGDNHLRRLVFTTSADGLPRLRLEDPARERIAAALDELVRSLRRSQIRLRRIEGGADAQAGEEDSLRRRIDLAMQQRIALDEKLAQLDAGEGVKVLLPSGAPGAGSPGLRVRMETSGSGAKLFVESARGSFQFLLTDSGS